VPAGAPLTAAEIAERVEKVRGVEEEVLRDLASVDRRIALRTGVVPTEEDLRRVAMGAVLAEDPTLAVIDGAIDPFSFDARARGLAAAAAKLKGLPSEVPWRVPGAALPEPGFEAELLRRLVAEEQARLRDERALPRSGSDLVRAVTDTWTTPPDEVRLGERDRWLARRLGELAASITRAPAGEGLDATRARELDDALDPLEHAATGLPRSTAEIVKLREVLEARVTASGGGAAASGGAAGRGPAGAVPASGGGTAALAQAVRAHLGVLPPMNVVEKWLATIEEMVLPKATEAASRAGLQGDALAARVSPLVLDDGKPCRQPIRGSVLRSSAAAPERAATCALRRAMAALDASADPAARAAVLVAMHDQIVLALWAIDVAGGRTIDQARGRRHLLSRPGPDVLAHWERLVAVRPAVALGGGLGAVILQGNGRWEDNARRWALAVGDVPFELAFRELHATDEMPMAQPAAPGSE